MQPSINARQHTRRAILACLTVGGLIVASVSGHVSAATAAAGAGAPSSPGGSTTTAQSIPPPTTTAQSTPAVAPAPPKASNPPTATAPAVRSIPQLPRRKAVPRAHGRAKVPAVSRPAPTVLLQRRQRTTASKTPSHANAGSPTAAGARANKRAAPNNVALAPQLAAAQAAAIAAALASSAASVEALGFYRIPLFLLPIYKAAAAQYGVPWQILAAINEVETNYGADLSVSSAGAVGWMQFMPATWLQFGVDALNAGYADPYNPVDAIFAAARYLRAAGAARDLPGALLAYNHSQQYVDSVLLRAKLIASYPSDVVATLTGLATARLPLSGGRVGWAPARSHAPAASRSPMLLRLTSAPDASAIAVQDGRIIRLGRSRQLGRFVVLQDVYGDEFTYAGLGSIAVSYPRRTAAAPSAPRAAQALSQVWPIGGKLRLFAHPDNPDAAALVAAAGMRASRRAALRLHAGALVSTGTVLGRVDLPAGAQEGHIRFAIRPASDPATIDPRPLLVAWEQLEAALHAQGATARDPLVGATARDALLLSQVELQRAVLSDPGVALDACSRREIASGKLDRRALAAIAYLSRSGLDPTVRGLGCHPGEPASGSTAAPAVRALDLLAINGIALSRHKRARAIADRTIRTLLTLPARCAPRAIWSVMRYGSAPSTHSSAAYWNRIRVTFKPQPLDASAMPCAAGVDARSARSGQAQPPVSPARAALSADQWQQLIGRIAALPVSRVARQPSAAAIRDAPAH